MEQSAEAPSSRCEKKFQTRPRERASRMPARLILLRERKCLVMPYIFFMESLKGKGEKYFLPAWLYHIKHLFVQAFSGKNFYARQCAPNMDKNF
ncbi:MAG: hypothetical protein IJD65_04570 [Mailhella sp.]|nr:hypothetical protein [Mailhella sp.]